MSTTLENPGNSRDSVTQYNYLRFEMYNSFLPIKITIKKKPIFIFLYLFAHFAAYNQNIKNEYWKKGYEQLPFWEDTVSHSGYQGYIDTFTIKNTHFRIVHNDSLFDGKLQSYNGNQWVDNINFDNLGNHNGYDVTKDFNNDGCNDLIYYRKWEGEIYFFIPDSVRFSDTVNCIVSSDWQLLDTAKSIYYENIFGKLIHSPVSSILFTFKNFKKVELARLLMYFDTSHKNNIGGHLLKCELYRFGDKRPVKSLEITKPLAPYQFDLRNHWKGWLKEALIP